MKLLLVFHMQGSVLRPQLFTLYASPVANIARKDGFSVQLYADDKQLYLAFMLPDVRSAIGRVERWVKEIKAWMAHSDSC